ncbi:MAG TPA: DUF2961 domain-containing protein [Clostridiales bacterium]|nr:DUF2961 domain-containing protein [Clostridiales bacterium]
MELFRKPAGVVTRWQSFENIKGEKGKGGFRNNGAKGHPSDYIQPGHTLILSDIKGQGIIRRIWATINHYNSPDVLRGLKLQMFWDHCETPAVSVPFGDFFGAVLGKKTAYENEFFADPEGRSFVCTIPMPFRKAAKISLVNETDRNIRIFYDVDYTLGDYLSDDSCYFHAWWNRQNKTKLGQDFEILPKIKGKGRFLGCYIGVNENPIYNGNWFGEGEFKVYLDGDEDLPTLVGTGTEDYIGSAWSQGAFVGRYSGCLIADNENHQFSFYRFHVKDPIYFDTDCRVTLQQLGGATRDRIEEMIAKGVRLEIVSVDCQERGVINLYEQEIPDWRYWATEEGNWCNFYREDDVCAVAYFYLDTPDNCLGDIQPVLERIKDM